MKHSIIYSIMLVGVIVLGAVPFSGYDVGKLHPVRIIAAERDRGVVYLTTDTGDMGVGATWQKAMENMEKTSAGTIFQGTVTFLILEDERLLEEVLSNDALSPNCVVCLGGEISDLEAAGKFLAAHKPDSSLISLRAENRELPRLEEKEGRFVLYGGEAGK